MKKILLTVILFAFMANVFGQLKVNSLGNVEVGSVISAANNGPVIFKINNVLAGYTGTSAIPNVSLGYGALVNSYSRHAGSVAIGVGALYSNTSSDSNTAIGCQALYNCVGDSYRGLNTATGFQALFNNTSGESNTANGSSALYNNTIGKYNTAIGTSAGVNANNLNNATAIGYNAKATTSNQVVIGNSSVTSASIGVIWSVTSDGRAKKNIQTNVPGLNFISRLQPVTYNFDLDALDELQKSDDPKINAFEDSLRMVRSPKEKEIEAKARANKEKQVYSGFIAQDVEKVARSIGYNFSGVDAPENGKGAYGLRYAEFVVPLVKAVQELSDQNNQLSDQNSHLQEQINELTGLVYQLLGKETNELRSENGSESVTGLQESTLTGASLEQNIPNPFSERTTIRYSLPETVKTADIYIFNMQGSIVKKVAANRSGNIEIQGSELQAGMYLYSLVADGKEVDTKRMILTK